MPRKAIQLSKSNTALVERAGAHGASDRSPRLDSPSSTGSPVSGAKNCPDSR